MDRDKHHHIFDTKHLQGNLKGHSLRGGAATLLSQACILVARIVSTAVLARLLSPGDFGLITMVVTVTAFADLFKDIGLSMATIQRSEINHRQVSNLFWVNVAAGLSTMLVVLAFAPLIVWFYGEPRLLKVAMFLSINFFVGGLTIQHQALLRRQMRFGYVAFTEVVAVVLSIAIAIGMAWHCQNSPESYMALVWMSISRCFFIMLGMWIFCRWRPGAWKRGAGTRSMLKFGAGVTGFNMINYFARNADNILIGKFCGAGPLAFYSKAYQFLLLPIKQVRTPLVSVAIPALSALQDNVEGYRSYMRKLLAILAFVTMPLMIYAGVFPDIIVRFFFGEQWLESIPIFCAMSFLGFVQPVAGMCGLVLMTTGKTTRYFIFGVFNSLMIVASFLLGIRWGTVGVAVSYTIVSYIILLPTWWFCFSGSPVSSGLFVRAVATPALSSLVMGVLLLNLRNLISIPSSALFALITTGAFSIALYLLLYCVPASGRRSIVDYVLYIPVLIGTKKTKKGAPPHDN